MVPEGPDIPPGAWGRSWRRCSNRWDRLAGRIARATGWRVWNPGHYGEAWHALFRRLYSPLPRPVLLFGLNPGPYGMAQTGIPFTDLKRLRSHLPRLAGLLAARGEPLEVPGLAPADLRPFLKRRFESSSVRIFRFLDKGFGSAERGVRTVVVANPCPLLFIDPDEGRNRTPADLGRAAARAGKEERAGLLAEVDRLRRANAADAMAALSPRGCVLLGRNAQAALGSLTREKLGQRCVVDWEHPARAVPETWSAGLLRQLRRRGLLS